MERQININSAEIYAKTAHMRNRIQAQMQEMEVECSRIETCIRQNTDGAASAALCDTLEANKQKAYEVAETLEKLISFMTNAAKHVEMEDRKIANIFNSTMLKSNQKMQSAGYEEKE